MVRSFVYAVCSSADQAGLDVDELVVSVPYLP